MPETPTGCDFLVIGAGIAGVCLADELGRRGASVILVEATQVCGGSSALNAGGVRQQFSLPINISMARRTVGRLTRLSERDDLNLSYRQVGYLFIIADQNAVPGLHSAIELQNSLDVPSRWLTADEVRSAVPTLRPEGIVGATFCPTDGYLDPNSLVTALASDARSSGVKIRSQARVVGFESQGERVSSVRFSSGDSISAANVVNCAGAWASGIAELYGASLPIRPWRSQCYLIDGAVEMPPDCPVTIDFHNGKTYFHGEGTGFLAGTDADDACTTSWQVPYDPNKAEILGERLTSRYNAFDRAGVTRGWAGMLEVTEDENPVADWTHFSNLYTMAGFSGHGLAIAPGLAEDVARELTGETPLTDLTPYRLERFDHPRTTGPAEAMAMR